MRYQSLYSAVMGNAKLVYLLAFDIIGSKANEIAGNDILKGLESSFLCTPVVVKSIVDLS